MATMKSDILEKLIRGSAEPLLVARTDRPDWPVVLQNPAFDALARDKGGLDAAFADVIESLIGRELALEVSESVRAGQETTMPVELSGRDYLLSLQPLKNGDDSGPCYCAAYWRARSGSSSSDQEAQQALLKAKRRIRDLTRDDPVTGLLNNRAFTEVLEHDWAVAAREKSLLALASFSLDDFEDYVAVFGRHASDSCLRRVAQALRRCLRRASDVAARIKHEDVDYLVVLAHSSEQSNVEDFSDRIAEAVRELGLHHPRSSKDKFVTVSCQVAVNDPDDPAADAEAFLARVLNSE